MSPALRTQYSGALTVLSHDCRPIDYGFGEQERRVVDTTDLMRIQTAFSRKLY